MLQGNRKVDDGFDGFHRLYYRCQSDEVDAGRLLPLKIKYANTSVNWSKHSFPWDVIFGYSGSGIFSFLVRHLPVELPKEQPVKQPVPLHHFKSNHAPLADNYAHSELWVYQLDKRIMPPKTVTSRLVIKEFRTIMSDRAKLLRNPTV
jgi:hypothetical protein